MYVFLICDVFNAVIFSSIRGGEIHCRRSVMHFSLHKLKICLQGGFVLCILTYLVLLSASSHFELMRQVVK